MEKIKWSVLNLTPKHCHFGGKPVVLCGGDCLLAWSMFKHFSNWCSYIHLFKDGLCMCSFSFLLFFVWTYPMNVWMCVKCAAGRVRRVSILYVVLSHNIWRDTLSRPLNHHGINTDEISRYFDNTNLQRLIWVNVASIAPARQGHIDHSNSERRESVTKNPSRFSSSGARGSAASDLNFSNGIKVLRKSRIAFREFRKLNCISWKMSTTFVSLFPFFISSLLSHTHT